MTCHVNVLAKSRNPYGAVLTTFQLRYWRAIHAELMTHRVFSRNASSSRAVPVWTMLKQVWCDPAGPIHWGRNQSGMQARREVNPLVQLIAQLLWNLGGKVMCVFAGLMMLLGLHKQVANRLLEPWQYIHVVVSATEWVNFFALRDHPDAQPEIAELARCMHNLMIATPALELKAGDWHLPYATLNDLMSEPASSFIIDSEGKAEVTLLTRIKMTVARTARASYMTHGDKRRDIGKDIKLHDRLVEHDPMHASPTEHAAQAQDNLDFNKNFRGFRQYRDFLEKGEAVTWGASV